jgi:hypothetical protein
MQIVQIQFDADSGLAFYKVENGENNKICTVAIENLKKMSLSDLDYCISTNVFIQLEELQNIFRDYLWTEDGEIEPRKAPDEPR